MIFIGLLRLKKRSTEKKTPWERRLPKATDSKGYVWSDTDLSEVLFHYAMFCDEENRDLSSKIYCFSKNFPKVCWTVTHICALPSAC